MGSHSARHVLRCKVVPGAYFLDLYVPSCLGPSECTKEAVFCQSLYLQFFYFSLTIAIL